MINNEVVYKETILLDEELDNRDAIINYILSVALKNNLISKVDDLKKAVIAREDEISTSIGFDIAMPHGKSADVLKPFIGFLRTKNNIHWDEGSDETVKLIFLIAVPSENKDNMHLKFISQISKKLLDDEFRERLLKENDKDEIYDLLQAIKTN